MLDAATPRLRDTVSDIFRFSVDLVPITPANYELAKGLAVRPDQEDLVASLQKSLADAYVYSDTLFRLAFSGEALVGYLLLFPYDSDQGRMVNKEHHHTFALRKRWLHPEGH